MLEIFFYRHTALKWPQENPYDSCQPVNLKILSICVPFSSRHTALSARRFTMTRGRFASVEFKGSFSAQYISRHILKARHIHTPLLYLNERDNLYE